MTKAQIWIAAFLGVFIVLFFIQWATKEEAPSPKMPTGMGMQMESAKTEETGQDLVGSLGCINCHGNDLRGTAKAPSLHGLASAYSREQLVGYLQNPASMDNTDRFAILREKYTGAPMPSFRNHDVKELEKVAELLLSLEK